MRGRVALTLMVLACAAVASVGLPPALGVPAGMILVLVAPGYACSALIFGRRRLERTDTLLLSVALSAALAALLALALNLTPWGLTARTWAIGLAALSITGIAAGPEPVLPAWRRRPVTGLLERILFVVAGVAVLAAIVVARTPVGASVSGYSELWVASTGHGSHRVTIGVRSDEKRRLTYRLVVSSGGVPLAVRRFALDPGTETEVTHALPFGRRAGPVTAVLYRGGSQSAYRRVRMVLSG